MGSDMILKDLKKEQKANDDLESELELLRKQLKKAESVIARLSECHFPKKPCAGVDLTQVMLEENCAIAKEYLKSRGE